MTTEWTHSDAAALLGEPDAQSHKHSRGVLGLRTGSAAYPGAAVLGAEAAWRTGVGLVRYTPPAHDAEPRFGLPSPAAAVLAARPETVFAPDDAASRKRCDAWVIGSGTDPAQRGFAEREAILALLSGGAPIVVDAGALDLLTAAAPGARVIATPHLGEFEQLWRSAFGGDSPDGERLPLPSFEGAGEDERAEAARILAERLGVTVLLKGSRTIAASPLGTAFVCGPATPWLATAGTGDVLAGVLGALLATHADEVDEDPELLAKLGATAAVLHSEAAAIASTCGEPVPGPITALDVARALPSAHRRLRMLLG